MTRGRALHIGVRSYDATVYRREVPRVISAEADAAALADLTFREGFIAAPPLLSAAATLAAVEDAFGQAQRDLAAGELFVVSFSGHGGRYADVFDDLTARPPGGHNRWRDEDGDGMDEAWCLFDGVLLDDRLGELLAGFAAGVEILVVSDSCYAGTMLRAALTAASAPPEISASVLLLAACGEAQRTYARADRGLFTDALLAAWDGGRFAGSHHELLDAIRVAWPHAQLVSRGPDAAAFAARRPFTILP